MQYKKKTRIFVLLPCIILFSVFLFLFIAMIPFLLFIADDYDVWFWVLISTIIFICSFCIWGIIVTCQYVDVSFNEIKLMSYKGKYCFIINDIDLVEIRKSAIGHMNIIIKTKKPIQLVKHNNNPKNKYMQEFGFIHSAKIVEILKHYISEEVPWIYNDYFKNPNLEPKKPKKK